VPLGRLDVMAVRTWLANQRNAGEVSASTTAKAYRLLARILGSAVEAGYIPRNPCTVKGAGVERAPEMRHISVSELTLLSSAIDKRYRALVLVAGYGGLRWGELVGLLRFRVNPLHATVDVAEQVAEINGQFKPGLTKTQAGLRLVTLPTAAMTALAEHLERYAEPGPTGLVFPAAEGGYMRRSNFRRRYWLPATKKAGLTGLRFHDLRHTAATLAVTAGATTKELMERMGHASPSVALRYQHVMRGRDAAIADALDRLSEAPEPRSGTDVARDGQEGTDEEAG
jgi:integrase